MEGFIAPDGANRSKIRSLRSLFWNGGGEIILFPEFYGNCRLALRDNSISPPLSGFARLGRCPKPCKGAALDLLGLCPRPRAEFYGFAQRNRRHCRRSKTLTLSLAQQGIGVPYFEEKGLDPKNLFNSMLLYVLPPIYQKKRPLLARERSDHFVLTVLIMQALRNT